MIWGIDYASVDGNAPPDFTRLRAASGRFAIMRASEGRGPDPTLARDWKRARDAGLVRGAYMMPAWFRGPDDVGAQVDTLVAVVEAVGGLAAGIDLPPTLDVEFPHGIADTGMTRAQIRTWIGDAVKGIRSKLGVTPMIYTSGRVWNSDDTDTLACPDNIGLEDCPLWVKDYPYKTRIAAQTLAPGFIPRSVPRPWMDAWMLHQYQGDALHVQGITATADLSVFRGLKLGARGAYVAWAQRKVNMTADGVYGPQTRAALQALCGSGFDGEIDLETFCTLAWA